MITDRLYQHASEYPDWPFLVFNHRTISYSEMALLVNAYAERLAAGGIEREQPVAMICGNRPAFLIAWFALSELGAITVPLNIGLLGDGLRYALRQSGSTIVLIESDLIEQKQAHLSESGGLFEILSLDDRVERRPLAEAPRRPTPVESAGAPNSILYTSGSTGQPKGAVISHTSYEVAGVDMAHSLGIDRNDRILVCLPLFHANPQMYAIMSALVVGATVILLERFSAQEFFAQARLHRATGFTYVGTVLSLLNKSNPGLVHDHEIKWCVGGGAPATVWNVIKDHFGIAVRELYGMTETGGWVSMNTSQHSRFGSVGRPRNGVEIRIVDEDGVPVKEGKSGEIVTRCLRKHVFFDGYWMKPELTAETMVNSWLHTGDCGVIDGDGYLYFVGRFKDLIRRGGEMISPVEIELQLLKHPGVQDCAVIGVADEIMGEEIKAMIVPGEPIEPLDVRNFLSERLPNHMLPRYIAFVPNIPKTATQKIIRHELAALDVPAIDFRTYTASGQ